ncbi:MAG: hypothetical protein ACC707_16860, partial [Thiohalomonadales bacterium]
MRTIAYLNSNQFSSYANSIFPFLNSTISPQLVNNDILSLQASIEKIVDSGIIQFAAVRNLELNIVAVSGILPMNYSQQNIAELHALERKVVHRELNFSDQPVGYIEFGFSLSPLVMIQADEARLKVVFPVLTTLILSMLFIAIVVYLTQNLQRLSSRARLVQKGDSTVKFSMSADGETNDIVYAFNHLISKLRTVENKRKDAQMDLARQRAILATTQTIAHMGYWNLDLISNKVLISEECSKIFGYGEKSQDINIKQMLKIVHKDDLHRVRDQFGRNVRENNG